MRRCSINSAIESMFRSETIGLSSEPLLANGWTDGSESAITQSIPLLMSRMAHNMLSNRVLLSLMEPYLLEGIRRLTIKSIMINLE